MNTPPPLPPPGVEFVRFEGTANGLHTVGLDKKRLDIAQEAARQWCAENHDVEVISIDSCFGNMAAFVTVWYRRRV